MGRYRPYGNVAIKNGLDKISNVSKYTFRQRYAGFTCFYIRTTQHYRSRLITEVPRSKLQETHTGMKSSPSDCSRQEYKSGSVVQGL